MNADDVRILIAKNYLLNGDITNCLSFIRQIDGSFSLSGSTDEAQLSELADKLESYTSFL